MPAAFTPFVELVLEGGLTVFLLYIWLQSRKDRAEDREERRELQAKLEASYEARIDDAQNGQKEMFESTQTMGRAIDTFNELRKHL